nr:tRNA lysidine(34) synthetase TilS [Actinomycetota bacterium]
EQPAPVELGVPGTARFGPWEVEARLAEPGRAGERLRDDALVAASELASTLVVRAWRAGDRMRPAGLGGSKSLQDLFTDRKVPRELRRTLPVVESDGEIVWVAGVAVGERFRSRPPEAGAPAPDLVSLSARRARAG